MQPVTFRLVDRVALTCDAIEAVFIVGRVPQRRLSQTTRADVEVPLENRRRQSNCPAGLPRRARRAGSKRLFADRYAVKGGDSN